jgi:hypothetical protein
MTQPQSVPSRRQRRLPALVALTALLGPWLPPLSVSAQAPNEPAWQVTLFAIIATPGSSALDPKLAGIEGQLRKLLPGHGFKLLDVRSKRLVTGESLRSDLGNGWTASADLIMPLDANGKVQLRCKLAQNGAAEFDTLVATPPNQLFFCDRLIAGGQRLLIGVGAR